jgi:hypothetical protein
MIASSEALGFAGRLSRRVPRARRRRRAHPVEIRDRARRSCRERRISALVQRAVAGEYRRRGRAL